MKKIYIFSLIMVIILFFTSSCGIPENWNTVEIDGYGTIKVPEDWKVSIIDDYMYFSTEVNGEEKYVLIQYDKSELETTNKYFSGIKEWISIQSEGFSNSVGFSKEKIIYNNGDNSINFLLDFPIPNPYNYRYTTFICVDDSISEETLRMIGNSYDMNDY